jgi:uncharacterized protein YwqG
MPTKQVIDFIEAGVPITEYSTKFGGQPNWIALPEWPLSKETGNPMRFICQIALSDVTGVITPARMAYIFMTDEEDGEFVDGTYEPNGGENAIILQPGSNECSTAELKVGPTLYRMVEVANSDRLQPEPCEFAVYRSAVEDVPYMSEQDRWKLPEHERNPAMGLVGECKVGGTPAFLQGDEIPFDDGWQFLCQIDSCTSPFYVNFGDGGVGYAFLNTDGTKAKFLWQCG